MFITYKEVFNDIKKLHNDSKYWNVLLIKLSEKKVIQKHILT